MLTSWLLGAGVLALAAAAPVEHYYAVKETHIVPASFTRIGSPARNHRIRLSIGLKQSRFQEVESHLLEGIGCA